MILKSNIYVQWGNRQHFLILWGHVVPLTVTTTTTDIMREVVIHPVPATDEHHALVRAIGSPTIRLVSDSSLGVTTLTQPNTRYTKSSTFLVTFRRLSR